MNKFSKLGINDVEFQVYQTLLKQPVSNILALSKKLKINRVTLYQTLNNLETKGLIDKKKQKSRFIYNALKPQKILDYASEYHTRANHELIELKKQIPLLNSIACQDVFKDSFDSYILVGNEALKANHDLVANAQQTITGYASTSFTNITEFMPTDKKGRLINSGYMKTVLKYGDKFVFPGDDQSIIIARKYLYKYPELFGKWQPRWIARNKFDMGLVNLFAFDNILISYLRQEKPVAYIIKNINIAQSIRNLCLFLWENANPIN